MFASLVNAAQSACDSVFGEPITYTRGLASVVITGIDMPVVATEDVTAEPFHAVEINVADLGTLAPPQRGDSVTIESVTYKVVDLKALKTVAGRVQCVLKNDAPF